MSSVGVPSGEGGLQEVTMCGEVEDDTFVDGEVM